MSGPQIKLCQSFPHCYMHDAYEYIYIYPSCIHIRNDICSFPQYINHCDSSSKESRHDSGRKTAIYFHNKKSPIFKSWINCVFVSQNFGLHMCNDWVRGAKVCHNSSMKLANNNRELCSLLFSQQRMCVCYLVSLFAQRQQSEKVPEPE